jgi:hypothetical protein
MDLAERLKTEPLDFTVQGFLINNLKSKDIG